jgi:hypothetical protein
VEIFAGLANKYTLGSNCYNYLIVLFYRDHEHSPIRIARATYHDVWFPSVVKGQVGIRTADPGEVAETDRLQPATILKAMY